MDENFEHTEPTSARYMQQILEGMQYVHKQNIVHLDLKPENIVCVDTTGTQIKIIDFGLASKLGELTGFMGKGLRDLAGILPGNVSPACVRMNNVSSVYSIQSSREILRPFKGAVSAVPSCRQLCAPRIKCLLFWQPLNGFTTLKSTQDH